MEELEHGGAGGGDILLVVLMLQMCLIITGKLLCLSRGSLNKEILSVYIPVFVIPKPFIPIISPIRDGLASKVAAHCSEFSACSCGAE